VSATKKYSTQWLFAVRTILQVELEQMKIPKFRFLFTVAFVVRATLVVDMFERILYLASR